MKSKLQFYFARKVMILSVCGLLMSMSVLAQLPTASEIATDMTIGWNLGNTLEATGGETAWGNPVATQELINSVKAAGFNTVRLPVSWDQYANQSTYEIDPVWMERVKEVVDYCFNADMYVILNIHWDGGWLENNVTTSAQASVNEKQQVYWTQIANYFKDYDEHLLFAGANEPHVEDATGMSVLLSYHQTFVDAVRATGGNNSSRTLIVQGPLTDIEKTDQLMNTMPTDNIAERLMAEVHYYTPYQFCLMTEDQSWGDMFYFWGEGHHSITNTSRNATWGEESDVENYFGLMQTKFVDNGIPVIMGEFGAIRRSNLTGEDLTLHLASREYYHKYIVESAKSHGMIPVYWDNGVSEFALFNRSTGAVVDQGNLDALMEGADITPVTSYTLSSTSNGSGSISFDPTGGTYEAGTTVTVTATADSGWTFSSWSGDLSGSDNPTTITVNSNKSITANFVEEDTGGSGTILGELDDQSNFELYPNPVAGGRFFIELPSGMVDATIRIIDVQGKLVHSQVLEGKKNVEIRTRLKAGIYVVDVRSGSDGMTTKLIVR